MSESPLKRAGILGWLLFDWACQPFFTLVGTFVFAPYFATAVVGDAVDGQAFWGYATAVAGIGLAVLSPLGGSLADAMGPKKPWIAVACGTLAVACALLWFATPGAVPALILGVLACYVVATVAAETATALNNAMMLRLVPPDRLGRLSGTGWAVGYAGGLVSLILVLGFLAGSPEAGKTYLGLDPLFGLDPARREGDRVVGPLAAAWLVVFVAPLFLLTPDTPSTGHQLRTAWREALTHLRRTVDEARRDGVVARFLVANMVYQDGLVALFAFGGIYGAGVFGWGTAELGAFGILLTVTGAIGSVVGGRLDDRIGARAVILGSLSVLVLVCLGILSLGREHVLFATPTAPPAPGDGLYGTVPEKVFLGLGLLIGAVAGPLQASSRSLLGRLVPASEAGRYFGLLTLSGKATSFLAPLLVAVATRAFETQAAGLAVLFLFFGVGALLLARVTPA